MSAAGQESSDPYPILLERGDDLAVWRDHARELVARGVPPENIVWSVVGEETGDLFGNHRGALDCDLPEKRDVRANRAFLQLAGSVILHRDTRRFALLYRLLWRLQGDAQLMLKPADPDLHRLTLMAGQVRRDIHKMRAFVRFRAIDQADGEPRYIAWFEPDHHILRANAKFFLGRFASQRWSILSPDLCLHWDGSEMTETPGARREDAPPDDAAEELWQRYYAAIFNPVRLKVAMMVKEMPRRYWKNLPEARLIPTLIAGAQAREAAMVQQGGGLFPETMPRSLAEIEEGMAACRRCPIGCNGTRAVSGEGPGHAEVLLVGEQPGDTEEREGRLFIGPAGQLLDRHLQQAGLDRSAIRVTNAVRHFKFVQQGKRRLHQNPTAGEIDRCRWWLDAERRIVKPRIVLALGASAGRALLGRTPSIAKERGLGPLLADGSQLFLTAHPSYLLRLDGESRHREEARFQQDLRQCAAL